MSELELEANQLSWNAAIVQHGRWKEPFSPEIAEQLRTLYSDLTSAVGTVTGRTLLQLCCNDGRDLLSLVAPNGRGIGVDFSAAAIEQARQAAEHVRASNCAFYCDEVVAWLQKSSKIEIDVAFSSLGSLTWIPDLTTLFAELGRHVKNDGKYVIWDFHPVLHTLDNSLAVTIDYPFAREVRSHTGGIVDYLGDRARCRIPGIKGAERPERFGNPHPVTEFIWSIGAIITAAAATGWHVQSMMEFPYVPGERYLDALEPDHGGRYACPDGSPRLPLTYTLVLKR